jgi:hypothetical protein
MGIAGDSNRDSDKAEELGKSTDDVVSHAQLEW